LQRPPATTPPHSDRSPPACIPGWRPAESAGRSASCSRARRFRAASEGRRRNTRTFGAGEGRGRELYERYHIPASGRIFWGSALANIHPGKDDTYVDYKNPNRAPLLFISGSDDHLMPPKIQQSNAKHYKAAGTVTEVKEFEGPHLLPSIEGWQEVADYALDWALRHAKTDDSDPA
jgi:pimeloyl-ACP methyl ester carboxylesterase